MRNKMLEETLHKIFRVSCFLLLVCNLIFISTKYMKYSTETNIGPVIPVFLKTPRVSICYKTDFLLTNESGTGDIIHSSRQSYINMTNGDVFDAVPRAQSVIDWCRYRTLKANEPWQSARTDTCCKVLKTLRYRMQSYICYRFEYRQRQVYSYDEIVTSFYGRRELFQLKMIAHFAEANFVRPLIHFTAFPIDDTIFNQEIITLSSDTSFRLSYDIYLLSSLPFPYDTKCSQMSRLQCIRSCIASDMRSKSATYDLLVSSEGKSHSNLTIIASSELMEQSNCGHKCISLACQQKLVNTHVDTFEDKNDADFIIETLDQPISKLQYVPSFTLIDYVTQAAGLIGIWLGLAFVSLAHMNKYSPVERTRHKLIELAFLVRQVTFTLHCHKFPLIKPSQVTRVTSSKLTSKRQKLKHQIQLFIEIIFKASVIGGVIWQLITVMINYLSYQTNSEFSYEINPIIHMPSVSFCFPLGSLVGLRVINSYDEQLYPEYYANLTDRLGQSIDDILAQFDLTRAIESCYFRDYLTSNEPLVKYDRDECKSMVMMKTFYSSLRLCLMIKPSMLNHTVTQSDVQNAPSNPGIAYVVRMNKYLEGVNMYKFTITVDIGSFDIPYESLEYSATYSTYSGRQLAIVSNRLYRVNLLPRPYDTDCDEKQSKMLCLKHCLINSLLPYDRTPYPISTSEGKNKLLLYTDLMNETIASIWRKAELKCINQCTRSHCNYNFTITYLEQLVNVTKNINRTVAVALASHPVTNVLRVAEITFMGLTYQLLSSLSFWCGFSLISLDPFEFHLNRVNNYLLDYVTEESCKVIATFTSLALKREKTRRSKKNHLNHQVKRLIIYSCACVGCIYQIVDSMKQYLNYPSSLDLSSQSESQIDYSLAICLNTEELLKKYESNLSSFNHSTDHWLTHMQTSLLSVMADEKESLESCFGWGQVDRQGKIHTLTHVTDRQLFRFQNYSVCMQLFIFKRVFLQNMPCYYMRPREYFSWNRVEMQDSLDWQRTLFLAYMYPDILTRRFTVAIGEQEDYPESSSFMWSPNIFMRRKKRGIVLVVSYFKYTQHLLPAPYSDQGFTSIVFDKCLNYCINTRLKLSNVKNSDSWDRNDLSFISLLYANDSFARTYIQRVRYECENSCFNHGNRLTVDHPIQSFIIPTVSTSADIQARTERGWILFWLKSSDHPVYTVVFRPFIPLLDQIINIGSILSIWFGISVIHLTSVIARSTESTADTKVASLRREIDLIEEKLLLMQNEARCFPLTARHRRENKKTLRLMRDKLQ